MFYTGIGSRETPREVHDARCTTLQSSYGRARHDDSVLGVLMVLTLPLNVVLVRLRVLWKSTCLGLASMVGHPTSHGLVMLLMTLLVRSILLGSNAVVVRRLYTLGTAIRYLVWISIVRVPSLCAGLLVVS
jgi:hypothetical protein